jgi:hypothetical protein
MEISTVGIVSPGDMGHAIGAVLHQHRLRVITNSASLYRFIEGTELGKETPEQRHHGQTLEDPVTIPRCCAGGERKSN